MSKSYKTKKRKIKQSCELTEVFERLCESADKVAKRADEYSYAFKAAIWRGHVMRRWREWCEEHPL